MSSYPAGWPFWQTIGRHGVAIRVRVEVFHDVEAGVYVAHKSNLPGLVAEGESLEELFQNVDDGAKDLLASYLESEPVKPNMSFSFCPA